MSLPTDGHVHTEWSWDTVTGSMIGSCERALELGLPSVAFTEHADLTPWLIPEPVHLPPAQAALVLEHKGALAALGLEVDDFGRGTVLLGGYPAALGKRRPREILTGVVDYLANKERPPTQEALLNDLLSLVACHAAVRAGDRLSAEEIAELAARRDLARDSHHCPHGRPTSLLFTRAAPLYFEPYGRGALVPDQDVDERHALNAWLRGLDRPAYEAVVDRDLQDMSRLRGLGSEASSRAKTMTLSS